MFGEVEIFKEACSIVNTPVDFYRQERDWTCSIACIRTAISYKNNRITEDEILKAQIRKYLNSQYYKKVEGKDESNFQEFNYQREKGKKKLINWALSQGLIK